MLSNILSNGISGRLVEEVRIKHGLTYSIESDYITFNDFGIFSISVGVQNDKIYKAIQLILDVLKELKINGINGIELNRAKNQQMTEMMITFQKQLSYFSYYMKTLYYNYLNFYLKS